MKNNKRIVTGLLALTLTAGVYLVTGCDETSNQNEIETVYNIKYELFGGINHDSNPTKYKASDETFSLKSASKRGCTFDGWYKEASFETLVTSIEKGDKGHIKLYAKFTPVEYTVEYDLAGGELAGTNPSTYTVESPSITIANPTMIGYTFMGWRDNNNPQANPIIHRRILTGSTGNQSFTAEWKLTDYTITVDSLHGSVEIEDTANYDETITFTVTEDTGYKIDKILINGEEKDSNTREFKMPNDDIEMKIEYSLIRYNINYNLDGGENHENNPETYTYESPNIELLHPTKVGYTFEGWEDDETHEIVSRVIISRNSTGNKSYTAKWTINSNLIKVESDHGNVGVKNAAEYNEVVTYAITPDEGYVISSIKINGKEVDSELREFTMPDAEVTIEVEYECVEYNVEYELNGGSHEGNPSTYTIESRLELNNPVKEGYAFIGWYEDEEFTIPYTYTDGDIRNLTLYARFAIALYEDTYYETLTDAIDAASENGNVELLVDYKVSSPITIDKNITIVGNGYTIIADKSFAGNAMVMIEGGNVTLENLTLDGNETTRVVRANGGHLTLNNTHVTNGYVDNYVSGVYITRKSTFTMNGGSITNNKIGHTGDYLTFATDLWIGSQASGTVASISDGAIVGNVFINSNSYKSDGNGTFTLDGGFVENVYVEYDDEAKTHATFRFISGEVNSLHISKSKTGEYTTTSNPIAGTYYGGYLNEVSGVNYLTLQEALNAAGENETIVVYDDQSVSEPLSINKSITIRSINGSTIIADKSFAGNAMVMIEGGNVTLENLTLDGNETTRVVRANGGHLTLNNTHVTNGYVDNYVSGVYITRKSTFTMNGGSITNNKIGHTGDYLTFATDLWIGSQASGTVASISDGAIVGNVFINSNSYKSDGNGTFTLDGGFVENVYVEYDDEAKTHATFRFISGKVYKLYLSTATTGVYESFINPMKGTYTGANQ